MHKLKYLQTNENIKFILKDSDPKLKKLIDYIGDINIKICDNYFESLVQTIIGQQLSIQAKKAIYLRFMNLMDDSISPEKVLITDDQTFKDIGISTSKITYIKNLSCALINKNFDFNKFIKSKDEDIINELTKIKGIGNWTAEMFLIFSLGREDIFSLNDVGLKRSIHWLYNSNEKLNKDDLICISNLWKPYRTFAALYLWEAINKDIINKNLLSI